VGLADNTDVEDDQGAAVAIAAAAGDFAAKELIELAVVPEAGFGINDVRPGRFPRERRRGTAPSKQSFETAP
jgi:hypothetical protein